MWCSKPETVFSTVKHDYYLYKLDRVINVADIDIALGNYYLKTNDLISNYLYGIPKIWHLIWQQTII